MIKLHKLNQKEVIINSSVIESLEANPDTTITLTNDRKYIVRETVDEVMDKVIEYQRKIMLPRGKE